MKSKKLLLGSLSAMALVATPIATVVSCGKDTPATPTKMVKASVKGYVFEGRYYVPEALASKAGELFEGRYYVPEALASKAGEFKSGDTHYKWDKKLSAADVKVKEVTKGTDGAETSTETHAFSVADASHFVLPLNGLSGAGMYLSKDDTKTQLGGMLSSNTVKKMFNIDLPTETKDKKLVVTEQGIKNINALVAITGLKAESIVATEVEAKGKTPKYTQYAVTWVKEATTGTGSGTGTNTGGKTPSKDTASVAGDLTALQTALGGATVTLSGTGVVAQAAVADVKAAGTAMTAANLLTAINAKNGTAAMAGVNLTDALVKKDMHITFEVNTASVAAVAAGNGGTPAAVAAVNGTATITISAGSLTAVKVVVTLVVA